MNKLIKGVLGHGGDIAFWIDCWIGDDPLYKKFPSLFAFEESKWCSAADRLNTINGAVFWQPLWRRPPSSLEECREMDCLSSLIRSAQVGSGIDRWSWSPDQGGIFSVNSLKKLIQSTTLGNTSYSFGWNNWVPLKVNFLGWRVELNRIPTYDALVARNIFIHSPICKLCGVMSETVEHLFLSCAPVQTIWDGISSWCKISPLFAFDIRDLMGVHRFLRGSRKWKKIIHSVVLTVIWCIWRARNDMIFNHKAFSISKVIEEIKILGFLWIKARAKCHTLSWEAWCNFDISCMGI